MFNQSEKIIQAFGGAVRLAKHLEIARPTVYRWRYSPDRGGTDGLIPAHRVEAIIKLANDLDIELDWTYE